MATAHLRHAIEPGAVSVTSRPRVPEGTPEHEDGHIFSVIEKEMSEIALPWASPIIRERGTREAYRAEAEAQRIRWNELTERWRWASVTGKEPPAAKKRPQSPRSQAGIHGLGFLRAGVTVRRLEHVVGLSKRGDQGHERARGWLRWAEDTGSRREAMARRIEILSRRRDAPLAQTLLPSRALAEDIRLSLVKVNTARKQERKKWCENELQRSMLRTSGEVRPRTKCSGWAEL